MSAANNGAFIEDQRTSPATLSIVYVDGSIAISGDGTARSPKKTISEGVTRIIPGGTIHVAAGTYTEQIAITKDLKLIGAGAGTTTVAAPTTLPASGNATSSIVLIGGSGVEVELTGLTVTGPGPSGCGSIRTGIYVYDGAYANIHHNTIQDIRDSTFSGCQNGVGIAVGRQFWSTTGTADIANNTIVGYQKGGIVIDNTGSNAAITNNTITGVGTTSVIAQNGIQVGRGATATLSGNTVTGNSFHLEGNAWDWGSAGILFYQSGAITMAGGNTIANNDQNLYIDSTTAATFGAETIGPSSAPLDWGYDVINLTALDFDLTAASFPAATTDAEIEARVWHKVDDPAYGLITWTSLTPIPTLTVEVKDSLGNPIEGATITYAIGSPNGGWQTFGTTGADGTVSRTDLVIGTNYHFFAGFNASSSLTQVVTAFDGDETVTFQTAPVKVKVETCTGTPHAGAVVTYGSVNGGFLTFGSTDAAGIATKELFPGYERTFYAGVNHTKSALQTVTTAAQDDPLVTFKTTAVTINYSGPVNHGSGNGGWFSFTKPTMEMFAGTHTFLMGGVQIPIEVSGCTTTNSVAIVKLINSSGAGIAGATAQYYDGGWKDIPGVTNANGLLPVVIPGLKGNIPFAINYAGARIQKTQNITTDSIVLFQTKAVTVKLLDSTGAALSAEAQYYANGWKTFGTTTTTLELLPTTYPFRVTYGGASIQKNQDVNADPLVIFTTKLVTFKLLNQAGDSELTGGAEYYASGWKTFGSGITTATMELLPTTYPFKVSYGGAAIQKNQNVADDATVVFNTKVVTVKLLDSAGTTDLTADADYYASGWKDFGTTPAAMELLPTTYPFKVTYLGASIQKNQDVAADPNVIFNTVPVTMKLLNSTGGELAGAGDYYASGWKTFGTTTATLELLPTTYPFRVSYLGASIQKNQNVATDPNVIFNTVPVTMKLLSSTGEELVGAGQFYASGWKDFGATTSTLELLPTTYPFKINYGGASIQKNQNVNNDPMVVFNTKLVTMKLLNGVTELAGASQYYASGWKTFGSGTTTTTMELLPTTYPFKVTYNGAGLQKNQDVSADPLVIFTGTKVTLQFSGTIEYYASGWKTFTKPTTTLLPGTYPFRFYGTGFPAIQVNFTVGAEDIVNSVAYVRLINSKGVGLAGATVDYYTGSWPSIGTTNSSGIALGFLPGLKTSTYFRTTYAGAALQKQQNIATDSFVVFQTVKVTVQLKDSTGAFLGTGDKVQYYPAGWMDFGNTVDGQVSMELLPTSYYFNITHAFATQQKQQNVGTNPVVVFQTAKVIVQLKDSTGNLFGDGDQVRYYSGGWHDLGTTVAGEASMELLPLSYPFNITHAFATQQKDQNVATNSTVIFQTVKVTVQLKDSAGNLFGDGDLVRYYSGGWHDLGTTVAGEASMELLPVTYPFDITHAFTRQQKDQNTGTNATVVFQTGKVHSDSANCTQYYTNGWHPFTQDLELLPGNFAFQFTGFPQTNYTITAGTENHIH
jgi:hypothetical protein